MRILRAPSAGFCMGVALALDKLDSALKTSDGAARPASTQPGSARIVTFGPLIHNPQALAAYARQGVIQTEDISEIRPGDTVIIRAHGIPLAVEAALKKAGAHLLDATCPRVKKAQKGIAAQAALGRRLLLLGEVDHPEVKGLVSYALPDALVFGSLKELQDMAPDLAGNCFLATQTTQAIEEFERVAGWIQEHTDKDIPILSTICGATRLRQEEARALAGQVGAVVVVGGLDSGNTRRLAQVVEEMGVKAYHVEGPEQLPADELRQYSAIGLTAGASTPKWQIDETQRFLEHL